MTKVSRREAVSSLLVGLSSLMMIGCKANIVKEQLPIPPERCVWIEFPYGFVCIDTQALSKGSFQEDARSLLLESTDRNAGRETQRLPSKDWLDCSAISQ